MRAITFFYLIFIDFRPKIDLRAGVYVLKLGRKLYARGILYKKMRLACGFKTMYSVRADEKQS